MTRPYETQRIVERVTQEDIDVARVSSAHVIPTQVKGDYTVDLSEVADYSQDFGPRGNEVTVITLKNGQVRVIDLTYGEFNHVMNKK